MKLNPSQQQAIKHDSGPLLIVAGAGTGKTTVLTERIKYLIQEKKVDPYHIFTATFTEKAAEELRSRLDLSMPFGYYEPWLGTFHGLCERMLSDSGMEIGLSPRFKILTQTNQWIFIREHLYDFDLKYYLPLGNPTKFISALAKFFSRLTDEDIDHADLTAYAKQLTKKATTDADQAEAERMSELAKAYVTYQKLKADAAVLDFGDLITYALKLLRARPNIRQKYQNLFEHILVDEFQDTNYAQFELIKLLAPPPTNPNLVVVGDDNQSIYHFRGASVSNILDFKKIYPQAKQVVLTDNYRSIQSILDSSYQSIKHNDPDTLESILGISKQLVSHHQNEGDLHVYQFNTAEDEVLWTVNQIINLVARHDLTYKDIAIMARSNSQLESYIPMLRAAGLPYQLIANHGLFDQDEVKTLLIMLQVLADPADSLNLFQLSQSQVFANDPAYILDKLNQAKNSSSTLWEELILDPDPAIQKMVKVISQLREIMTEKSVSQLTFEFVENTKYLSQFTAVDSIENQLKIKNLNLFFNQLKRFETSTKDRTLVGFLSTLELWFEAGENPGQAQIEDIDTISLLTVHASKGLEYQAVFVGGLVAGRFPSNNRSDLIELPDALIKETLPQGDEHLQEERRLFYVAMTRAKSFLYLTYAEDVGGTRKRKMSGFLTETGIPVSAMATDPLVPLFSNTPVSPKPKYLNSGKYTIDTLSYSQLKTFKDCPLKYKYRYLLRLPTKTHHSLSFGQTMHQVLHDFHFNEQRGYVMTLPELIDLYSKSFIELGYDNPTHKHQRFEAGKLALANYYSSYPHVFGKPLLLEQSFSMNLDGVKLVGKIDRIDEMSDGKVELIDYKTGEAKKRDQKAVDKDDQLTLYALAAKNVLNLSVDSLSLYYLEGEPNKLTTTREESALIQAKSKLIDQIHQIQNSDFPAKPDPVKCGFCEYLSLCPFATKKSI